MKNTLRAGLVMAGFVLAVTLKAQDADLWQQINTKYPGEPAVYIERSETLSILPKGDSLVVYSDVFDDILYLKEPTEMMASRRVHGSHFTEVQNLKAKTLVWEKSRHKELTVSNFARKFDTDDGIFHDDSYYYPVSSPAVAPRTRTQLEYRNNYRDPKFIPGFIFSSYLPQEKTVYTIKTTPDVDLMFEVLNDPERKIQCRKYERGKTATYEWTAKGLEATKLASNSPSLRYYAPHMVVTVKSFKTASGRKKVLSSLDDLYGWYYSFISQHRKDPPSADLVKIVEELKTPNDTRDDIVKKIYYWVQDNIRYIAFEEGMRGLIPHTGSYVCEKRYGD